ncbi:MAG: hypothetical protein LBI39_02085 [Puniceicoccales bacterium]|jgi:hypothetical protein|nr:hypothetical protein [Puniceicoccales bacterium]
MSVVRAQDKLQRIFSPLSKSDRDLASKLVVTAVDALKRTGTLSSDIASSLVGNKHVARLLKDTGDGRQLTGPEKFILFFAQKTSFFPEKELGAIEEKISRLSHLTRQGLHLRDLPSKHKLSMREIRAIDGIVHNMYDCVTGEDGITVRTENKQIVAALRGISAQRKGYAARFATFAMDSLNFTAEVEMAVKKEREANPSAVCISVVQNRLLGRMGVHRCSHLTFGPHGHVAYFPGEDAKTRHIDENPNRVMVDSPSLKEQAQTSVYCIDVLKLRNVNAKNDHLLRQLGALDDEWIAKTFADTMAHVSMHNFGYYVSTLGVVMHFFVHLYNLLRAFIRKTTQAISTPISGYFHVNGDGTIGQSITKDTKFDKRFAYCSGYVAIVFVEALRLMNILIAQELAKKGIVSADEIDRANDPGHSFLVNPFASGTDLPSVMPSVLLDSLNKANALSLERRPKLRSIVDIPDGY